MVIFIAFCLAVSLHILAAFKDAIDNPYARQNHPKLGMGNVNLTLLEHEKRLAIREFERVQPLIHSMRNVGWSIYGFYHTSVWQQYWKEVIVEQMKLLDGERKFPKPDLIPANQSDYVTYRWDTSRRYTSLLNMTEKLFINVATDADNINGFTKISKVINDLNLQYRDKIVLSHNRTIGRGAFGNADEKRKAQYLADNTLSTGEFGTIEKMQQFCEAKNAAGEKAMVYYVHSKASCCLKDANNVARQDPRAAWREYMNAFNIEFPSICMRALAIKKYLTCGVENQDAHYSGNFWWADCQHVARLPHIQDRYDFMAPEFFVLRAHPNFEIARNFGYRCGYSIYNCNLNLYDFECSRMRFRERLTKQVLFRLSPSSKIAKDTQTGSCREVLKEQKTYYEQQSLLAKHFGSVSTD